MKSFRNFFQLRLLKQQEEQENNVVIDTSSLFSEDVKGELMNLEKVFIPLAVFEEIHRMACVNGNEDSNELSKEEVSIAASFLNEMLLNKKNKWDIIGSRGTGIVGELRKTRIIDLNEESQHQIWRTFKTRTRFLDNRSKNLNPYSTLYDLLGMTDLRVIASARNLQKQGKQSVVLITKDKIMLIIAKEYGLGALESLK